MFFCSKIPIQSRRQAAMEVMQVRHDFTPVIIFSTEEPEQRNAHVLDFLEFLPALPQSLPLNQVAPIISSSMQQV